LNVCQGPTSQTHYFEVSFRIVPDETQVDICNVADQVLLGNDLNQLLLEYGIGEAGPDDNAIYRAGVCPQPMTTARRRSLLVSKAFIYLGGGGCRFCLVDSSDKRKLLRSFSSGRELVVQGDAAWFAQVFAPQTKATLENAIKLEIAPNHQSCLGITPSVEVTIHEVSLADLNLACEDGTIIESLQSLKLTDINLRKESCSKCTSIDFSKKGDNQDLYKGDYVKDEWKASDGLSITASGGYSPGFKARIFDTGDPVCVSVDGSRDFGSPNNSCGGIGVGAGGAVNQSGENCRPLGSKYISHLDNAPSS